MLLFEKKIIESIKNFLTSRNETIAIAESATGGFLQAALSSAVNSSKFYQGGLTVYNIGQKCRHLNVEPIEAENTNCVSTKVACEMALNVCDIFCCDWGISITGYTSPHPKSEGKLFAYYAVSFKKKIVLNGKILGQEDNPVKNQILYVRKLLRDFNDYLGKIC